MSDVLAARIAQPDLVGLPDWEVAAKLNAPDPAFGLMPVPFSCRSIAEPAVISGELELLDIVRKQREIPADVSPTGQAQPLPTSGLMAVGTLVRAVETDLQVNPLMPGAMERVVVLLNAIEDMGLLSAQTKAAILAPTMRPKSWAQAHGITVTEDSVFTARGRPRFIGSEG